MANTEIANLEQEIFGLTEQLNRLRAENPREEVCNYSFATANGETSLDDLFGNKNSLMVIHNMGQGCRFCALWADGFNGFVPHLESALALLLVSRDAPELQRQFANSRSWRFRLASDGGGDYSAWPHWARRNAHPSSTTGDARSNSTTAAQTCSSSE